MNNCRISMMLSLVLLLIFIPATEGQAINEEIGKFEEAPCPFPLPEGLVLGENFKFGYVTVPEFHEKSNGRTLQLAVAIFPSYNEQHAADPIVMNTSGPGKSNMDNFVPDIAAMLGQVILPDRDIVIIELRGLRYSKPFLMCKEVFEARKSMMEKNLNPEETRVIIQKALKASQYRFLREGIDLSAFNNVETAADIALIMTGLGYDKFNIVGSSAGTLVAHHVIRDYPERVRCVIMDAGLPIDPTILRDMAPNFIQVLKRYFEECSNDPDCRSAYPDLEKRFLKLLNSLNQNPVTIPISDPEAGKEIRYVLNGYRMAGFVAMSMYYTTQIPHLIDKILAGDYSDVKEYAASMLTPSYFADGLGHTIFLSEAGNYSYSDIKIDPAYSVFAKGVTSSGLGGEYELQVKEIWNIPGIDPKRIQYQEQCNVPVLVLNGMYDPVIPAKYDAVMKKHLNNCHIFRFDGVPHSAFDNAGECVLPMMLEFLQNPAKAPDSSCVKNYKLRFEH
ncbi:MAG: alpha/beta hydrolase [Planctomycetota bacterium]